MAIGQTIGSRTRSLALRLLKPGEETPTVYQRLTPVQALATLRLFWAIYRTDQTGWEAGLLYKGRRVVGVPESEVPMTTPAGLLYWLAVLKKKPLLVLVALDEGES